jgi:hypothetical protein
VTGPEPDFDELVCALHCVPSSSVAVECRSVGAGLGHSDTASSVTVVGSITIGGHAGSGLTATGYRHGATGTGV